MGIQDLSIYGVIKRNAGLNKGRNAFVCEDEKISCDEFREKVDGLAAGLRNTGLCSGQRVGVLAKNGLPFLCLIGAVAKMGAILLPINWRLNPQEIGYILTDGSPTLLFVDPEFQDMARSSMAGADTEMNLFSTEAANGPFKSFDDLLGSGKTVAAADHRSDDPCTLLYTAAVHGRPRGAMLTHQGLLLASTQLAFLWGLNKQDVGLAMVPLFHVAGLLQVLSVMLAEGASIIMPRFDPGTACKHIEDHKVTIFFEFPPMLTSILEKAQVGGHDLSSMRHALGIDHPDTVRAFEERSGATYWAAYGQSETSGLATLAPYFERPGSAGFPTQFAEVEVVDDSGNVLERGASGEIVVRGPQVFNGYWNREAETQYTFRDGWHHTGDMGRVDEDGYLWFEGRAEEKDLIKPGGENVYPAEVEEVILECPMVKETAVIGVPDPDWGEAVKAICVLIPGASLSEAELIAFVAQRIARFKKPKHVVFVDALPKMSDGTLDRREIKAHHGAA